MTFAGVTDVDLPALAGMITAIDAGLAAGQLTQGLTEVNAGLAAGQLTPRPKD